MSIRARADEQGRALTSDERAAVERLLSRLEELRGGEVRMKELGRQLGGGRSPG